MLHDFDPFQPTDNTNQRLKRRESTTLMPHKPAAENAPGYERRIPTPMDAIVRTLPRLILASRVGNAMDNEDEDITCIQEQLAGLGYLPERHAREPDRFITRDIEHGIRAFQRNNNLREDGWAGPGGETEKTINKRVSKALRVADTTPPQEARVTREDKPSGLIEQLGDTLGDIGKGVQKIAKDEIRKALPKASENFEHYDTGDGKPPVLDGPTARDDNKVLQDAQRRNQKRFEDSMTGAQKTADGKDHPFFIQLKTLKPGQSVTLTGPKGTPGDDWKADYGDAKETILNKVKTKDKKPTTIDSGGYDEYLAHGRTGVQSRGDFKAEHHGDKIIVTGKVKNLWDEQFNFEDKGWDNKIYKMVADAFDVPDAKNYNYGAQWERTMRMEIPVKNGAFSKPKVVWEDTK